MWRLCCPYLFLISPSFGASGGFRFVIVAFPEYLHSYFYTSLAQLDWSISDSERDLHSINPLKMNLGAVFFEYFSNTSYLIGVYIFNLAPRL